MPTFPASGGGPNSGPGLNPVTIFVSPDGNDGQSGLTSSTAVKTGYVGYAKIVAAGGGILTLAQGTHWGGPVANQGIWIRGDGATVAGFQTAVPCIITGEGASAFAFSQPVASQIYAGASISDTYAYRKKPGIWLCKAVTRIKFANLQIRNTSLSMFQPVRLGWDYNRNADGTVQTLAVTHAVRSSGSTTYDVTLPAGYTISNLSRTSNVVTATVDQPNANQTFPPWRTGQKVYINSTDVNFASGSYTITSVAAGVEDTSDWSFTYAETAANASAVNPGNVQSHGCSPGEYLDLDSVNADFPATQYLVTATTYNSITVTDPWGGEFDNVGGTCPASATADDIGTLSHQERQWCPTFGVILDNVSSQLPSGPLYGLYYAGPCFDSGGQIAIGVETDRCQMQGEAFGLGPGDVPYPRDDDRMAALFMATGSTAATIPSLIANNCSSADGGIRVRADLNGANVVVSNWLQDVGATIDQPPGVDVIGNADTRVYVDYVVLADADPANPVVRVTGTPAQRCVVTRCEPVVDLETTFGDTVWQTPVNLSVGAGSGQITVGSLNGNAIQFFDQNQVTIGVVELKDFTTNL